ncbi:MAG: caspase family protein [Hyphomicrobiaceae bacterium]
MSRQAEIVADGFELGWALGDSLVIANGANGGNGVEIWPTLVGNAAIGAEGKQTYSVMNRFDYKLDAWRDLRLSVGIDAGVFEMGRSADSVVAHGLATSQPVICKAQGACFPGSIADRLNPIWRGPNRWQLEGGVSFTHAAGPNGAPRRPMVRHTSLLGSARPSVMKAVDPRRAVRDAVGWRSLSATEGTEATARRGFQEELARFGIALAADQNPESLVSWQSGPSRDEDSAQFKYPVARIESEMRAMIPDAETALQRAPMMADMTGDIPKIFLSSHARGIWRWRIGGETLWLVQVLTIQGSGGFGYGGLYLFRSGNGGAGTIVNLTDTLGEDRLSRYGAIGTDPQIRAFVSQSRYLLLAAPLGRALAIYDLVRGHAVIQIADVEKSFIVESLHITDDGRHLVQRNTNGSLALYVIASGKRIVSGRYVDGEIILYDDQGHYDATYEGGHFVHLRFPGTPGLHTFHQFSAKLKRPDIVRALLKGAPVAEDAPQISAPPTVEATVAEISDRQIAVRVVARSGDGLAALRVYQDGLLTHEEAVTGNEVVQTLVMARSGGARRLAVVASDRSNTFSLPAEQLLPPSPAADGSLRGIVMGVDTYHDRRIAPLAFAAADARNLVRAMSTGQGKYFARIDLAPLTDAAATPSRVLERLEQAVAGSRPGDTVVFFFSGHGLRSRDGEFFFATSGTDPDQPQATALAWSKVSAVLRRSKARVLVLIDACHSGLAGELAFASNDDAVAQMMSGLRAPIVILAASKGRQLSQELASIKGGAFTRAIEAVIAKDRARFDTDQSGTIEISELYAGVKRLVLELTGGQQTPWLARSDMIGDFTLF